MKKQFLSASVIALTVLAASCSKNETMQEIPGGESSNVEQISFRSSTGNTRANDFELTDLESGFNVVGVDKNGEYIAGFAAPTGDVETYYKTAGAWGWKTPPASTDKLWPKDDALYPLTFFMAYPITEAITKDVTKVAAAVTSNMTPNATFVYNTFFEGTPVVLDATKVSVDELAAMTVVTDKPADGFANLSFKHIMSNIAFDVKVPAGIKAVIHSIKIANVNKSGRSYDYKAQAWSAETAYDDAVNHAHYAHFVAPAVDKVQEITFDAATVNGFSDGVTGYNTLKLMPQTAVTAWAVGTFTTDAAAWKAATWATPAAAIEAWHKTAAAAKGMLDSEGWKGARIEVIYCLVDVANGKNLVGRLDGVDGADATQFVRVGYALDLAKLETKAADAPAPALMGLTAGYKYKFTISLGTADATNGTLLDPDFKDENGDNTETPVDNPKSTPGDPVTKDGVITFNVAVDKWVDHAGTIK